MATVEDVLITEALNSRPSTEDAVATSQAFVELSRVMANEQERLPQALCDLALHLCGGGSAGIGILTRRNGGEEYFYWEAISGLFAPYAGGSTPRDFSPCGISLDRHATQLFSYPGRFFTYLEEMTPEIVEAMVVPFYAADVPMGAIWVLSHDAHQFTRADARTMEGLGAFTAAALSLIASKRYAEYVASESEARQKESELQAALLEELNTNLRTLLGTTEATARELTAANEVKDQFISLITHELRSPLTVILGYAKLLLHTKTRLTEEGRTEALFDIEHQATRLQRRIENLLLLARPEAVDARLGEPVAVRQIMENVVEDHKRYFGSRPLLLPPGTYRPVALGNSDFVEEILENLVSNAEKYSPAGEVIELLLEESDGQVEIAVLDAGPGVDEAERDDIFSSFYRSSKTSSQAIGLGIGLAVCKQLVEKQGGKIWVTEREGGGSAFRFTLPAQATPV